MCISTCYRRSANLDVEVAASGFTKDLAAKFDEAAEEFNILGGPDNPREEGDEMSSDEMASEDSSDEEAEEDIDVHSAERDVENKSELLDSDDKEIKGSVDKEDTIGKVDILLDGELGNIDHEDKDIKCSVDIEDNSEKVEDRAASLKSENSEGNVTCDHMENITEEEKHEDGDDDIDDDMCDLVAKNREYRPFRNDDSRAHINSHLLARSRNSDSMCSVSTTSSIAAEVIRAKVKKQQKQQQDRLKARRIRKSGEASLQTRHRRDTQMDIKQSTSDDWF